MTEIGARARWARLVPTLAVCAALLAPVASASAVKNADAAKRTTCSTTAYHGDKRLGPKRLPTAGPIAKLLRGWERLAGLTVKRYLRRFYDEQAKSWRYPPKGGYQLTPDGTPVLGVVSLITGQQIDRFGSEGGTYLSPIGTPYGARGIPPESLNPFPDGQPCNYSRYEVVKPFPVDSGPIAPALGQPGLGLQYVLNGAHFPGVTERVNVAYLLANGYLRRVGAALRAKRRARYAGAPAGVSVR